MSQFFTVSTVFRKRIHAQTGVLLNMNNNNVKTNRYCSAKDILSSSKAVWSKSNTSLSGGTNRINGFRLKIRATGNPVTLND